MFKGAAVVPQGESYCPQSNEHLKGKCCPKEGEVGKEARHDGEENDEKEEEGEGDDGVGEGVLEEARCSCNYGGDYPLIEGVGSDREGLEALIESAQEDVVKVEREEEGDKKGDKKPSHQGV